LKEKSPSFTTFWKEETVKGLEDMKSDTFLQCLDIGLRQKKSLLDLDSDQRLMACLLKYLLAQNKEHLVLEKWEVEAIVAQTVLLPFKTMAQLHALESPPPYDSRAHHLASVLVRGWDTMGFALDVCGHPKAWDLLSISMAFNGKLFYNKYMAAKRGVTSTVALCEGIPEAEMAFHRLNRVVANNGFLQNGSFLSLFIQTMSRGLKTVTSFLFKSSPFLLKASATVLLLFLFFFWF
jgi:hypothetical protein